MMHRWLSFILLLCVIEVSEYLLKVARKTLEQLPALITIGFEYVFDHWAPISVFTIQSSIYVKAFSENS